MVDNPTDLTVTAVDFDPFAGPEITWLAPVTDPQLEIWTACVLGSDDANRAYNESTSFRLTGALDRDALERAFQALVGRHEALRSVFSADGRYICVLKEVDVLLFWEDIAKQSASRREQCVADYVRQDVLYQFDLQKGPLLKAGILKLQDDAYHLTLTLHHLICDGWSIGVLLRDLSRLYSAYSRQTTPNLPDPVRLSYYADEYFLFRHSADYRRTEQFWLDQFRDGVPVLNVPTDFPRPVPRTYASRRLDAALPAELVAAVKRTGTKAGASFVITMLAAFEVLLAKLTGQTDLVVGLPAAGQAALGYPDLVGHCVNLLPLRSTPQPGTPFCDYLNERKRSLYDALDHQQITFGALLQKLAPPRDPARIPFVPVVFNIDARPEQGIAFEGLTHRLISNPRAFENFEIFLNITDAGDELVLEWSFNTQLFRDETIRCWHNAYTQLLRQLVEQPTARLADLRLTANAAPALPLNVHPYPDKTLTELLAAQLTATPHRVAVMPLEQDRSPLTYQALHHRAGQLAGVLHTHGVRPGNVVGVAVERSPELLIALLAVLKAGAAYLPLDPDHPHERLDFMLTDAGATCLLTSPRSSLVFNGPTAVLLIDDALREADGCAATFPEEPGTVPSSPDDTLCVLFTSGSTGQPKGVALTHRNVVNFLWAARQTPGITPDDILLAASTVSFDIATYELFMPLLVGAAVIIADAQTAKDGRLLARVLESRPITLMFATPSRWRMVLDAGWTKPLGLTAISGGEFLPRDIAQRLVAQCQALWNVYGPTETTIWSILSHITADAEITIGHSIANTSIYLLDEAGRPVEPGAVGEIHIGGAGVGRGYLNRPDLNARLFIPDPYEKGARLFRTGDLGTLLPSGEYQCLGRADQQVKLRGNRVELGEIEQALFAQPGIRLVAVVLREDRPGDQRLVAYIVPANALTDGQFEQEVTSWKAALARQLPTFMVPNHFVQMDDLPQTTSGKTDRRALPKPSEATSQPRLYVGARTDVERMVADIWAKHLNLDRVDVFTNFFDLGGHSLIAVKIMIDLERKTGQRLPLASLFTYPTVEKLTLLLQMDGKSITWDSLVPIKPYGSKTPLYIVHGAGMNVLLFNALATNMDADQPVFGLQAKGLNGIDKPAESIEEMAAHYISAIIAQNPDGPYALAGYSFGGMIAYEMNRQFNALGKRVTMLALFDSYAIQGDAHDAWLTRIARQSWFSVKNALYTLVLLKDDFPRIYDYKREQILARLAALRAKFGQQHGLPTTSRFGYIYELDVLNEKAQRHYKLMPQAVSVDLFRARKRTFYTDDFEYLGWKPFALNGVRVHDIPGEHNTLFAPPNDKEFARILQETLDKC